MTSLPQQCEDLSDLLCERQMRVCPSWWRCVGLGLQAAVPDETLLVGFRQRLMEHGLQEQLLQLVNRQPSEPGLIIKRIKLVDATLVPCASLLLLQGLMLDWRLSNDTSQAREFMRKGQPGHVARQAVCRRRLRRRWVHDQCRLKWSVKTVINRPATCRRHPQRLLAGPDERHLSRTQGVWPAVGGGKLFQRFEADDGFDADLSPACPTSGRGGLQGAGLHPPPVAAPLRHACFQQSNTITRQ